ncbi:EAL domain-containing protein [Duganella sp. BJB488]|uniref:EAL domain-containing protein n=1 Tax=unclassified Duganella TaxID=2636909 RepID=UPI000E355A98|nr:MULTISPECIES: EAL domain-containing protein [unclassified Duganella]RFP10952.1 EAL domain-containing protein [Duganella sp. BJB489]RFP14499.1 EAL domain-containing protein [Duganella sp. BJB488]RFP30435.1 EAL domain-containing protein [Duganella sp. BJB480]
MKDERLEHTTIVLVIDDDPFIRLLARDSMEKIGLQVVDAADASSGLAAISAHAPDIILLDVVMPGINGFEACSQARQLPNMEFCPIVMLTAHEDTDSVTQAYEAGATDFVGKPVNWQLLQHRVRFLLRAAASFRSVAKSDLQMANAQRISSVGSWEWRIEPDIVTWSNEMYRICNISPAAFGKNYQSFLALVHPADRVQVEAAVRATLEQGQAYDLEHRLLLSGDVVRTVHGKADVVFDPDGKAQSMSGTLQDITQRKLADERIHYLANYDELTAQPNRNLLVDRLNQAINQARRNAQRVTVLYLNLDGFKFVNDSYGHAVGNSLLQAVAARIKATIRESDTVARFGGDEFVLIFPGLVNNRDVLRSVQRALDLFVEPFIVGGRELRITASIGVCLYPDDGADVEALLKNADVAMYEAKESGRNCFRFYAQEMGRRIEQYVEMENALRVALDQQQFEVYYQPKVNLFSGKFGGVEALIRWIHPQNGMIQPGIFIPLAEKTGLIVPIGEWVLRTACIQAKQWHDMGFHDMTVAVNLSAYQFGQQNVAHLVERILTDTGLVARHLELELTESMLMGDSDSMLTVLRDIKELGVTLTLDDFGTGYSSLAYLKRFPIDVIKIDRSFVSNITTDPNDASLTRTIVLMAKSLKMKTVAEGVETEGQLGCLSAMGCDDVQGFYFSRAVPAAALTEMLRKQQALPMLSRGVRPERTILLLDDEPHILSALRRVFRNENYQILQTTSPFEAFELLATHRVQVVISDQRMPSMSGTAFLSKVKELHPDTLRIILSGYTELESVIDAINRGAVYRFFTKPWDDQQLREQIREVFDHHWRLHGNPDQQVLQGVVQQA